jgi:ferredoxin/flavodoxin---NADP+ reductase
MTKWLEAKVLENRHWTEALFTLRVEGARLDFEAGQFVRIALDIGGERVARPFSMVNAPADPVLEFYGIVVPEGPLSPKLKMLGIGDKLLVAPNPAGFLVLSEVPDSETLWLVSTGTGIAPFASVTRDPETYERFEQVVLVHACRQVAELEYGRRLIEALNDDPLVGELAADRLVYYPSCTREEFPRRGRITALMDSGQLFDEIGAPPLNPAEDRVMICGSMEMIADCRARVEAAGLKEGANSRPAEFVVEKSFVD